MIQTVPRDRLCALQMQIQGTAICPLPPPPSPATSTLTADIFDGRVAGHLGAADGLKTSSIHVCVCPHFGM